MSQIVCMLLTLIVKGTSISDLFQFKLNKNIKMHLLMRRFLELMMWNMFPIICLRNYMIVGQKQLQTLKYDSCQNDLHEYHVFTALFLVSRILKLYRY